MRSPCKSKELQKDYYEILEERIVNEKEINKSDDEKNYENHLANSKYLIYTRENNYYNKDRKCNQ